MRILILGSGGMLGHVLTLYLSENGHDVADISRTNKCRHATTLLDVLDTKTLSEFLNSNESFDYIVNCIALLPSACRENPSKAILLNSFFPHWLEQAISNSGTRLIQVSTGGVYAGDGGPYTEESLHDTSSFYGRTKSLGEVEQPNVLNVRSDYYGPDLFSDGVSIFNWLMQSHGSVDGFANAFFNGVSSLRFAEFVNWAVERRLSGSYNLHSSDLLSKADFAKLVIETFDLDDLTVADVDTPAINIHLASTRSDIDWPLHSFGEDLADLREWMISHKSHYGHYSL